MMKKILLLLAIILPFAFDSYSKEPVSPDTHEWVDLGLPSGTLWATCNVGANSPEEYGDYFAWGEISTKESYDYRTYKWYDRSNYEWLTKYSTNTDNGCPCNYHRAHANDGFIDGKTELEPEDDAATVNWGPQWRMPTQAQQYELLWKCTWNWAQMNGVNGYLVIGPNGKTIFLPAAGRSYGKKGEKVGSEGCYWSCEQFTGYSRYAYEIFFNKYHAQGDHTFRSDGFSVRPVRAPQN